MENKKLVGIIMGSVSDLPIVEAAINIMKEFGIEYEVNALSAHRTPDKVAEYARTARERGLKVIIAAAGGAAHLPGVIAAHTELPVIGIPIKSSNSIEGLDSVLSILQMPQGIPVATVALNGAANAAILAVQIIAIGDREVMEKMIKYKKSLADKVVKANEELKSKGY